MSALPTLPLKDQILLVNRAKEWAETARTLAAGELEGFLESIVSSIPEPELHALGSHFVFGIAHREDAWLVGEILHRAGPGKMTPILQNLLEEKSNAIRLLTRGAPHRIRGPETPVERICFLLARGTYPPLATRFLNHPNQAIQRAAITATCATGRCEAAPFFRAAVSQGNQILQAAAENGLRRAMQASRLEPGAADLFYPGVLHLLVTGGDAHFSPGVLMDLNRARALADFHSDALMNPEFPRLYAILRCLRSPDALPSREKLETIFQKLEGPEINDPGKWTMREVLRLIGHHRLAKDEARLRFYMGEEDKELVAGAAKGLLALHGLDKAGSISRLDFLPEDAPLPIRQYHAIHQLNDQVIHRDFREYFMETSGDSWQVALTGLEEAGSCEKLAILKAAVALFGSEAPSSDQAHRREQLAALLRGSEWPFKIQDDLFAKSTEHHTLLLTRLVLKHEAVFLEWMTGL
jgi:hypothetical protein